MPAKAKELDNRREGDRRQCGMCNPRPDRVRVPRVPATTCPRSVQLMANKYGFDLYKVRQG